MGGSCCKRKKQQSSLFKESSVLPEGEGGIEDGPI